MFDCSHARARVRLRVARICAAAVTASALTVLAGPLASTPAGAKSPGARYCFSGICHRVMTLSQTEAAVGKPVMAVTSFYDDCRRDRYNPCGLTSSGEAYRPGEANSAASPIYPDGTVIVVRNPANGELAIVRINNAGPYWGNRTLDLSRAAGFELGLGRVGVAKVEVTVLRAPNRREATYRKGRRYPPLPGHVGRFASLDEAHLFAAMSLGLPDALRPGTIAVAHADPQAVPVAPVGFEPLTGPRPDRRLPADVVRVSALERTGRLSAAAIETGARALAVADATAAASPDPLVARATEIRGASLLVPPAGETTRVVSERVAIMGALRAGDFDRRARSLLTPVSMSSGDPRPSAPAGLAAVSADDRALGGAERLTLERMPPLATNGERTWYRRALAPVSHEVDFAPTPLAARATHTARWAALRRASFVSDGTSASADTMDRALSAERTVASVGVRSGDERLRAISRGPARARNEFDGIAA